MLRRSAPACAPNGPTLRTMQSYGSWTPSGHNVPRPFPPVAGGVAGKPAAFHKGIVQTVQLAGPPLHGRRGGRFYSPLGRRGNEITSTSPCGLQEHSPEAAECPTSAPLHCGRLAALSPAAVMSPPQSEGLADRCGGNPSHCPHDGEDVAGCGQQAQRGNGAGCGLLTPSNGRLATARLTSATAFCFFNSGQATA